MASLVYSAPQDFLGDNMGQEEDSRIESKKIARLYGEDSTGGRQGPDQIQGMILPARPRYVNTGMRAQEEREWANGTNQLNVKRISGNLLSAGVHYGGVYPLPALWLLCGGSAELAVREPRLHRFYPCTYH